MDTLKSNVLRTCCTAALLITLTGCGARGSEAPGAADDHEHGEDTHTHEAASADTAGTYVDSTGVFFDDDSAEQHEHEEADAGDGEHSHDDDSHSHD